jgi:hypothetical protein
MEGRIENTSFEEARDGFKEFLRSQGHPYNLLWIFREDIILSDGNYFIRLPNAAGNEGLARRETPYGQR